MKYSFLEEKYNNKYKLFEYDQFGDEEDEDVENNEEIIDDRIRNDYELKLYKCDEIDDFLERLFSEDIPEREIKLLLEYNRNYINKIGHFYQFSPFFCNEYGTPLMIACSLDNIRLVDMLLKEGAAPNIQDKHGNTALMKACYIQNPEIVERLLEENINIDIKNDTSESALIIICGDDDICEEQFSIAKLLLKSNANTELKNKFGETALMKAVEQSNYELIKLLLEYGANINTQNSDGNSVLEISYENKA